MNIAAAYCFCSQFYTNVIYVNILWLLQALISVSPDEETYDEEDCAFCLEMLLRIALENR